MKQAACPALGHCVAYCAELAAVGAVVDACVLGVGGGKCVGAGLEGVGFQVFASWDSVVVGLRENDVCGRGAGGVIFRLED